MEKRYQVFVSSTSKDLQPARQEVSKALLQCQCFPAQMENWAAIDAETFEYIKEIIQKCDYLILVSAGMYGSIHPDTGLSYTEMEFDYALEIGKPIIRLLHQNPFKSLAGKFIEPTDEGKDKLRKFRKKLEDRKLCKYWENPSDLGKEVVLGLSDMKIRHQAIGWTRADGMASEEAQLKIAQLSQKIAELELTIEKANSSKLNAADLLEKETQEIEIQIGYFETNQEGEKVENNIEIAVKISEFLKLVLIACSRTREKQEIGNAVFAAFNSEKDGKKQRAASKIEFSSNGKDVIGTALHKLQYLGLVASRITSDEKSAKLAFGIRLDRERTIWELTEIGRRTISYYVAQF